MVPRVDTRLVSFLHTSTWHHNIGKTEIQLKRYSFHLFHLHASERTVLRRNERHKLNKCNNKLNNVNTAKVTLHPGNTSMEVYNDAWVASLHTHNRGKWMLGFKLRSNLSLRKGPFCEMSKFLELRGRSSEKPRIAQLDPQPHSHFFSVHLRLCLSNSLSSFLYSDYNPTPSNRTPAMAGSACSRLRWGHLYARGKIRNPGAPAGDTVWRRKQAMILTKRLENVLLPTLITNQSCPVLILP